MYLSICQTKILIEKYALVNVASLSVHHGYKSKYEKVGVLPTRIVKSNVSSVGPSSERNLYVYFTMLYISSFFFSVQECVFQ